MLSRVLVAVDDSEIAERVLEYAFEAHPNAEVTVLHVVGTPTGMMGEATALSLTEDFEQEIDEDARELFDAARELAADHDSELTTTVGVGRPARAVLDRAGEFDVVIIGAHEGTIVDRLLVGDVAKKIVQDSPVPVTVVQ